MINISPFLPAGITRIEEIGKVIQAALDAADPRQAVSRLIHRADNNLFVGEKQYNLEKYRQVFLLGAGKASYEMALAVADLLVGIELKGAVIVKHKPSGVEKLENRGIKVLPGDHPTPGEHSLEATREILRFAEITESNDLVIFTLSGGASALLTSPVKGISLTELQNLTRKLLACGADIGEINTLRKHLDVVKGGGLARLVWPAEMITLALSDVIGSPPEVIGSGPASADNSTFADALNILKKYRLTDHVSESIVNVLSEGIAGRMAETLRRDDPVLEKTTYVLVGSNVQSVAAAQTAAKESGFDAEILSTALTGEASEVGKTLANMLVEKTHSGGKPLCLLAGGETTVTIKGNGLGGRNLELALGAVETLAGIPGAVLITVASDGDDGTSGAAGAVVTGDMLKKALEKGISPSKYLENNDSLAFFQRVGGLILTGPTGTNVNDLVFLFGNIQ